MDHMGFLKHLRKYKAEIGSLKATIGNLERDIDILTGNRDYWREQFEQREWDYLAHIRNLEKMLQPLPDDILEQMKNARAMIIAEDPKLEFMQTKDQEAKKPSFQKLVCVFCNDKGGLFINGKWCECICQDKEADKKPIN